jgi:hypothetical protein
LCSLCEQDGLDRNGLSASEITLPAGAPITPIPGWLAAMAEPIMMADSRLSTYTRMESPGLITVRTDITLWHTMVEPQMVVAEPATLLLISRVAVQAAAFFGLMLHEPVVRCAGSFPLEAAQDGQRPRPTKIRIRGQASGHAP